jgi:hypothetical protein
VRFDGLFILSTDIFAAKIVFVARFAEADLHAVQPNLFGQLERAELPASSNRPVTGSDLESPLLVVCQAQP